MHRERCNPLAHFSPLGMPCLMTLLSDGKACAGRSEFASAQDARARLHGLGFGRYLYEARRLNLSLFYIGGSGVN